MPPAPAETRESLTNLLRYAEAILKTGERVIADLSKDAVMVFHERDIADLEGVAAPGGDGSWLRVARLRETAPPEPDDTYRVWLAPRETGGTLEPPRLKPEILIAMSPEEAAELVATGRAAPDDILRPLQSPTTAAGQVDVLLRLASWPEFAAAFDAWVAGPWTAWADHERPRRRSITFYNKLFEVQQRMASMGDDVPIEAVFGVGMARWTHAAGRIDAPLIEAAVELELDPEDGAIAVRPLERAPSLRLGPFDEFEVEGVGKLQREAALHLDRLYADPDIGFSPYERASYDTVLRMCHARLAADAVFESREEITTRDNSPPKPDATLRISDTWVLYVRRRSVDFRCDDIRRLAAKVAAVQDDAEFPMPAIELTSRPSDRRSDDYEVDLGSAVLRMPDSPHVSPPPRTGPAAERSRDARMYFFPLPYNDDQIEIVERLEQPDVGGVVVQGPPGTGKSHTIANIVAHYMATGRRVLVSAHNAEALSAIQGKLPESIRDLAISVIHSDREGARRLERAIDVLASQVKQIDKREYNERRLEAERSLAETRRDVAAIDEDMQQCAKSNLTLVTYRGEALLPMALAARVESEASRHDWFPDKLQAVPDNEASFSEADIADARQLRALLGDDLAYRAQDLPEASGLPDVPHLLAAHEALAHDLDAEARSAIGTLPMLSLGPQAGLAEVRILHDWLAALDDWMASARQAEPSLIPLYQLLAGTTRTTAECRKALRLLSLEWAHCAAAGRPFVAQGVELPDLGSSEPAFDEALGLLADGRKPFGFLSFGKTVLKAQLDAVRVGGTKPGSAADWSLALEYRVWQLKARDFLLRWSVSAVAAELPSLGGDWEAASARLLRTSELVATLNDLHPNAGSCKKLVKRLFPYRIDAERVVGHGDAAAVREVLAATLRKADHEEAYQLRKRLLATGELATTPFHDAACTVAQSLGSPIVVITELAQQWRAVREEAQRLDSLRAPRTRLETIAALVAESGAPNWAAALLRDPPDDSKDWTPARWRDSWEWARAAGFLRDLPDGARLRELSRRRAELEMRQMKLLAEIVRLRTFIGLKQGITDRIASALTAFAMQVRQLGAGTGKSAERRRRAIREAVLAASSAVPCWILPEWRVAEQLPSELALFDLVIIDEASQSDITSLPAVLRGKKLLVVGDDKQVSPSAVGLEERFIIQLRETYLRAMDIANYLEPSTSLYDLASMKFPGSVVLLREHFRCVEPIIAFSSRFYPKALIPLRVATARERLDPPLIDVYLRDGQKVRDVNAAEVDYIVNEIARLTEMPEYVARSMGVISLIGDKQAKRIQDRLMETVGTEIIERHRIVCGSASTFQGQERDIMFLSMVACPGTARAQTARMFEQRFNVAMSRARDRMYLVRSVAASMLSPADLKSAVIEHFRKPMAGTVAAQSKDVLDACESGFERDVGAALLDLGYRVRPQVQVGSFRIDFVIEGDGDRRLAVELDGDQYHGPEKWLEDLRRQRALERLGWVFWRCWGSSWLADRQTCLDDLHATLDRLDIQPIGGEFMPQIWTEHVIVGEEFAADPMPQAIHATIDRPALAAVHDAVVAPGDTVIVRFAADNRVRRFRLSPDANDPEHGVVHVGQPIGMALLGNGIEEEVDIVVDGQARRVVIEKITKAA